MKNLMTHVGVVIAFLALAAFFFKPAVFGGKQLIAGDSEKVIGMNKEISDYQEKSGEGVTWTGSMFSGMPSYTVSTPKGLPNYLFEAGAKVFWFLGTTDAGIIFLSMFGMYLLMLSMGYGVGISVFAAVAFAFSSYFIIILPAGHVTKAWAMSYMPLVLLGMLLLMRQKWVWGTLVFAASLSAELRSNHIQITYYLAILCFFLFAVYLYNMLKEKAYKTLLISVGLMGVGVIAAVVTNAERLYSNYEMGEVSTRGPSRLSAAVDGKTDKSSGLDQDYAFAWSYGAEELMTLIIPNAFGGESGGELDDQSHIAQALRAQGYNVPTPVRMPTYWGDQPFTSGPVYLGAVVCFLAVLAFFIGKSKYKWAIVAATVFLMILSLGKNAQFVNDFLFHHLPMYNKFRTPSMALVIPQITFAVLGCMALKRILDGDLEEKELQKGLYIACGITGGLCLLVWAVPDLFLSFTAASDEGYTQQYGAWFTAALQADRADLASADARRSLLFIIVARTILWAVCKKKYHAYAGYGIAAVALLTLVDLWGVSRRYCNDNNYVTKVEYQPYQPTVADNEILKDKDLSYRVLTFNNPFNDTHIPYFHKSIGGYNAAKLRDYQDLIDQHIEPEMRLVQQSLRAVKTQADVDSLFTQTPALNMLNMRYLILNEGNAPLVNKNALGNAWFVQNYKLLSDTAISGVAYSASDLQMRMLSSVDLGRTALVENQFKNEVDGKKIGFDPEASIVLTSYKPNELVYKSKSKANSLAVFSEVYYPKAWTAYIDGQEVPHFRSDWLLRSLVIPAGEHSVVFKCEAKTYWTLRTVSSMVSLVLLLLFIGGIAYKLYCLKKGKALPNVVK
ncbi:MAG: hypothetical protein J5875_01255 [Paludibacteraceae bacterium]|nr:hypothetical protein [Paludibacteraceae bacterium]